MRSRFLLPVLGFWSLITSINALNVNFPDAGVPSSHLMPRKWNPLPNPYQVPDSPIVLDFDDAPDRPLVGSDVRFLFGKVRQQIVQHIQEHGDSQIPLGVQIFRINSVEMMFDSHPAFPIMLFSDILAVVRGFQQKMAREGFRERTAIVTYEDDEGHQVETGEVDIARIAPALPSAAE
ncbi:MAG: hypothetical protein LQ338_008091 [Usnochroma carphineum]|nr:MAG: hypothetical protein LQ338_008091 [Usnochroma carphineum]